MDACNIFLSRKRIYCEDDRITTKQVQYLRKLCNDNGIEFPFDSMYDTKSHLQKKEASKAIDKLLKGEMIVFIYPSNID